MCLLGHIDKRAKLFVKLKFLSADIFFLQEIYFHLRTKGKLKANWIDQIYQANFNSTAKDIALLFRKRIPFIHNSTADPHGSFLIITGSLNFISITFVNMI